MIFSAHPGYDLLCSQELFLWEDTSLAVYGDFVVLFNELIVHARRQGLGDLVVWVFGGCGCCRWDGCCGWSGCGRAHVLGDGFVCCNEGRFEGVEVITINWSNLGCPELDFCLELVAPSNQVGCVWLELDKGGLGCEANVHKVGHDRMV